MLVTLVHVYVRQLFPVSDHEEEIMTRTIELQDDEIAIVWSVDDVMEECKWLTKEQACDVLHHLDKKHDANVGVNWETIHYWGQHLYPQENGGRN